MIRLELQKKKTWSGKIVKDGIKEGTGREGIPTINGFRVLENVVVTPSEEINLEHVEIVKIIP